MCLSIMIYVKKMGYVQTGKVEHVNEKMDIVFYEKNWRRNQTDNFQSCGEIESNRRFEVGDDMIWEEETEKLLIKMQ